MPPVALPTSLPSTAAGRSPVFVFAALLLLALAITGFWPQYWGAMLAGRPLKPPANHWAVHVHASLFTTWLAILLVQSALVWRGRTRMHRQLGPLLAAFGFVAALMGLYAGGALARYSTTIGRTVNEAAAFLFAPLSDMLVFAAFLAAAVVWRRRPEAHKRLMILAAYSMALVAFARLVGRTVGFDERWVWMPALMAPLLLIVATDAALRRTQRPRVHPVWWIGIVAYLLLVNRDPVMDSDTWLAIGRWLLSPS